MSRGILKWVSVVALSLLLLLTGVWRSPVDYRTLLAALVVWAIVIVILKPRPRLSIASITEENPKSRSL